MDLAFLPRLLVCSRHFHADVDFVHVIPFPWVFDNDDSLTHSDLDFILSSLVSLGYSGLYVNGFNTWQAVLIVFASSILVSLPFVFIGGIGAKYHISTAMILRSSFGIRGSYVVSVLRGIFASIAFGLFTWLGGQLIYGMVLVWQVGLEQMPNVFPEKFQITSGQGITFIVFWFFNVLAVMFGMRTIRWLIYVKVVVLAVFLVVLVIWSGLALKTAGPLLQIDPFGVSTSLNASPAQFLEFFFAALCATMGFWFLFSMNISDYTRYARSNADQAIGQAIGIPLFTTLIVVVGIMLLSFFAAYAGLTDIQQVRSISLTLIYKAIKEPVLVSFVAIVFAYATLVTNVCMNLVVAANMFSNVLPPRYVGFRAAALVGAVLGVACCPWYLSTILSGASSMVASLGVVFSGVIGVMLVDYYWTNRGVVDVDELNFAAKGGRYWYTHGFNWYAFGAWSVAVAVNVPGMLAHYGWLEHSWWWWKEVFSYAWLVGVVVASVVYGILMKWVATRYGCGSEEFLEMSAIKQQQHQHLQHRKTYAEESPTMTLAGGMQDVAF